MPGQVLIVQAVAKHYREPFFSRLCDSLASEGVGLRVLYSAPNSAEATRGDSVRLPSRYGCEVRGHWWLNNQVLYQPIWEEVRNASLIIVEHANKYLNNPVLMLASAVGVKQLAFWGHGRNRQRQRGSLGEQWKRLTIRWCDHWFAYTQGTSLYLQEAGFPKNKITVVQNSVDLTAWRAALAAANSEGVTSRRAELDIPAAAPVGLFCGSLHRDKCLDFLIAASERIRERIPAFHLVVAGAGPESHVIRAGIARHNWMRYVGPTFGLEKAILFRMADVMLNPGLVGLGVLDAFAAGLPLVTTDVVFHSPEIEYIEQGSNGIVTPHDDLAYAEAVAQLLHDPERRAKIRDAALLSSSRYSIEDMVQRFFQGVMVCLAR